MLSTTILILLITSFTVVFGWEMCICFIFISNDPEKFPFRICLASNRDEHFARPSLRLQRWDAPSDEIVGGRDLQGGGTWIAANSRNGKIGLLLNLRDRNAHPAESELKLSRGNLVPQYLDSALSVEEFVQRVASESRRYDPFLLIMLEPSPNQTAGYEIYSYMNCESSVNKCGVNSGQEYFGFGNSHPDKPFLKVKNGLKIFQNILETVSVKRGNRTETVDRALFSLLSSSDRHFPDDAMVDSFPANFPGELLEQLSSINVQMHSKSYGTRAQTLLYIDFDGNGEFVEKDLSPAHLRPSSDVAKLADPIYFRFTLE